MFFVLADFIQRMTPDLIDQFRLTGVRLGQFAAAIPDGHRYKVDFLRVRDTRRRQLFRTGSGDNGFIFYCHGVLTYPG
ncbi:hypothetical protein D3C71_1958120 [compost metagenome]